MTPSFSFIHVSDLHWGDQHDPKFALANARVTCFCEDVRTARRAPRPDWLVVSGDLTTRGTVDPGELRHVKYLLDGLQIPYNVIPGNHDLCPSEAHAERFPGVERYEPGPLIETAFARTFGERGLHFTERRAGIEFIGFSLRAGDPDGELARLDAAVRAPSDARARILIGHYPSSPVRDAGPLARWGPQHLGATAPQLDALLAAHARSSPPVVAYLFGHVHVLVGAQREGVWRLTPGAVAVGCPGYRLFEVFDDAIRTRFIPLSDPDLAACGFWGTGNPEGVRDSQHPDFLSYHAGNEDERVLTIPLRRI